MWREAPCGSVCAQFLGLACCLKITPLTIPKVISIAAGGFSSFALADSSVVNDKQLRSLDEAEALLAKYRRQCHEARQNLRMEVRHARFRIPARSCPPLPLSLTSVRHCLFLANYFSSQLLDPPTCTFPTHLGVICSVFFTLRFFHRW